MLLVVTFHYVVQHRSGHQRAIFPVTTAELERQLELLARRFEPVGREELLGAIEGRAGLPAEACLITFDDGLRSQFELALPLLERLGVPAIFFVAGVPLAEGRPLQVHKLHAVRERLADEQIIEYEGLREALERLPPAGQDVYPYDTPLAALVKRVLTTGLPAAERDRIVDALFARVCGDERRFASELYMSREQVAELERQAALGSHGYAHRPLASLGREGARRDLEHGASTLAAVTGLRPLTVSYPYGNTEAVTAEVASAAAGAGFRAGFTTERAINLTLAEPLLLGRADTNDAPGGRSPLLDLDPPDLGVTAPLTLGRRAHFVETSDSRRAVR